MKRYLFKKTLYNCKQATQLALKKEGGKISLAERVKLFYHLMHCVSCQQFVKQSGLLNEMAKRAGDSELKNPSFHLSEEKKRAIQHELDILNR